MSSRYRLGVDVGGTHTDLVLLDAAGGTLLVEKVASTPKNPALGVLDGVAKFVARGIRPADIDFFAHGTTITTNALLEMRGAKVGLLITKGFRAVQEIQSQARDGNLFDYFYAKPAPLAPQSFTKEIPERSDYQGNVLVSLDRDAVRRAARELKAAGVRSIAVCFLFSYANPAHEEETRRIVREEFPDAHVSLSSQVLPRIREWPRLSTTLINAYLEPVMIGYIDHLNQGLDRTGLTTQQRFLMQSNGGVMPFAAAIAGGRTVHTLLSGPAAGAQASAWLAERDASRGLVTLDMGGTSADIAFIEGGVPLEVTEGVIARRQIDVPALDMTTISAGGGSIAWVDAGGFDPLKMSVREAAAGIRRIVDMRMADEIRVFAAKRGVDLTSFTLLPFGGAGAVHAAAVAEELNIPRILVPPRPGAFSALGLLCTDVVHDYIRSELKPLDEVSAEHAEEVFRALEARARQELGAEGLDPAKAHFARELDLRYTGQGYELRTSLDGLFSGALTADSLAGARSRFDERHAQIHGHAAKERPVEVVSYRVRLTVDVPKYRPRDERSPAAPRPPQAKGRRTLHLDDVSAQEAVLYERDALDIGAVVSGPAILEQFDATTVIPAGWRAEVDPRRNLVLRRVE